DGAVVPLILAVRLEAGQHLQPDDWAAPQTLIDIVAIRLRLAILAVRFFEPDDLAAEPVAARTDLHMAFAFLGSPDPGRIRRNRRRGEGQKRGAHRRQNARKTHVSLLR